MSPAPNPVHKRLPALMAALLSGALLACAFPWFDGLHLELLAWCGVVPLIWAMERSQGLRRQVLLGLVFALTFSALCILPLAAWRGGGVALLWLGYVPVPLATALAYVLARRLLGIRAALACWVALSVVLEYLFTQYWIMGAPWWALGASQTRQLWLIQFADLTGVWGVTAWLLACNALLALVLLQRSRGAVAWLLVLLLTPWLYGSWRLTELPAPIGALQVAAISPGFDGDDGLVQFERALAFSEAALAGHKPDLLLWPESVYMYPLVTQIESRNLLLTTVERWQVPLMLNAMEQPADAPGQQYTVSALLTPELATHILDQAPAGAWPVRMDRKRRLTPLAEWLPYPGQLAWFYSAVSFYFELPANGGYTPGSAAPQPFHILWQGKALPLGAVICFELLFPDEVAQVVGRGARALLWLTNDQPAEEGPYAYQFAQFARLRAVETRRDVVRANLTGWAFVVGSDGRIRTQGNRDAGAVMLETRLHDALSVYVRHPHGFLWLCAFCAGLLLSWGAFHRIRHHWNGLRSSAPEPCRSIRRQQPAKAVEQHHG